MLGNIQTLLSGRNWLCLILKQHNKGYISFILSLNLFIYFCYSSLSLSVSAVPACLSLSSLTPSLPPSLASSLLLSLPYLPPSLSLSFTPSLHLTLSHTASPPWLVPSFPPLSPFSPSLLLSLAPSLLPELCPLHTSLTFYLPPSLALPFLPGPNKNSLQSHM